jgi:hypothetical protein
MGAMGNIIFMRYEHYGIAILMNATEQIHYFYRSFGIQITGWFIGKD